MQETFHIVRARPLLQNAEFAKLFVEELGWEPSRQKLTLAIGGENFELRAIANKRGFTAWACECPNGKLPDHATRLKLDRKLAETSFEHLVIFVTDDRSRQSWMWVRREKGQPVVARTHEYHRGQPGDALLQKLESLYVSLEEEERGDLSTVAMAGRARAAFDIERVTKAFYRDFDAHRKAFLKFIHGIGDVADREWYASVMLNRLMFVYFIQRKGFLDGDRDYLRNRLDACKKEKGKDQFYSFYRYFLLRLFHEGFGKRRKDRAKDLEKLLGNIPYLNGGLFDVHELEKPERYGTDIQIPDKAFEAIFDYFDRYQWHLDDRALRADNEINPDVLGYIFEKYINQKQMGAYYTKEDITEYIGKNTVIPFLFDAARAKCKVAFENTDGPTVWDLLRENPDRYIYPAVRYGTDLKLPKEIAAGLDTKKPDLIERRKPWNKPAPPEYGLPTEIWRETVARRQRYEEVRIKLAAGEVREINDFITLNLDLRQFAQDVIVNCEGPDLLMAFWQAISSITILDPTGGSGAFIFAALNILDPLYEACLDRMEAFLAEWGENGKKSHPNYHKKFTEVLARVEAHPNRRYFVLKSITLNNLYAVDIMEEAVEICKLRLFLKLASLVDPNPAKDNLGIEPLPDIDFNIRAGNTLVGYATYDEVKRAVTSTLDFDNALEKIAVKAADIQQTFDKFRELQTEGDGTVPAAHKQELLKRLKALEHELNTHLAGEYGVNVKDKVAYAKWLASHQPFHWFIEFYGILNAGGFDVIIGNPPYVEKRTVDSQYRITSYDTETTNNLYAYCSERAFDLLTRSGRFGFIVPLSSMSTDKFEPLQKLVLRQGAVWLSNFDDRPSRLFDGLEHIQLTIILTTKLGCAPSLPFTTTCRKWSSVERQHLFGTLRYSQLHRSYLNGSVAKAGGSLEVDILDKLWSKKKTLSYWTRDTGSFRVYYTRKVHAFLNILDFVPKIYDGHGRRRDPSEQKTLEFDTKPLADAALCALNSTLFRWFLSTFSDCRNLNRREVLSIPVELSQVVEQAGTQVAQLARSLSESLQQNSETREMRFKDDVLKVQCIIPRHSKPILDEIDTVLAGHYGFTPEELDFIINYDIKYRLGRGAGEEDQ